MADDTPIHSAEDIQEPKWDQWKREHFWVIVAHMAVSEDEIIAVHSGTNLTIDPARIVKIPPPTCFFCQMPWILVHSRPCYGDLEKQFADHERHKR